MAQVIYSSDAIKALRRMPANRAEAIRAKIEQYAADPKSLVANVKRLRGRDAYRLRIGNDRVLFDWQGDTLRVRAVRPRGGAYRD